MLQYRNDFYEIIKAAYISICNRQLQQIAGAGSTNEWITFRDSTINPRTIFTEYKNAFELSADDEMIIQKVRKDNVGFTHFRHQQVYKRHKVLYGEYIIHQRADGIAQSANGRLITGINATGTPSIQEKAALNSALAFMNAAKYLWQNPEMEKTLKRQEKNELATYYPKGEWCTLRLKDQGKQILKVRITGFAGLLKYTLMIRK